MTMRIQEIAEELVSLSVKEVNELAHVMNNDNDIPAAYGMAQECARMKENATNLSPKDYGRRLLMKRHKGKR